MTPTLAQSYKPKFRTDVTVTVNGVVMVLAAKQCLTDESAFELRDLLEEEGHPSTVIPGPPQDFGASTSGEFSAMAPHLRFHDGANGGPGTIYNAGILADHFARNPWRAGDRDNVALRYVLEEIRLRSIEQGFSQA